MIDHLSTLCLVTCVQVNDSFIVISSKPSDLMNKIQTKKEKERERERENKTARRRNIREGFFVSLIAPLEHYL